MDDTLSGASVTVHLYIADTLIEHHVDHDSERVSFRVNGENADHWTTPTIYLTGTPEELIGFARRVMQAVANAPVEVS